MVSICYGGYSHNYGHPNCVIVLDICLRILLDHDDNPLTIQSKLPSWTKCAQVLFHQFRFWHWLFDDFEEFLNNFETLETLLVTEKAFIDENVERILNKMTLFMSS